MPGTFSTCTSALRFRACGQGQPACRRDAAALAVSSSPCTISSGWSHVLHHPRPGRTQAGSGTTVCRRRAATCRARRPTRALEHGRLNLLLQRDLRRALGGVHLHAVELVPLLFEHQLRAGRARAGDEHRRLDAVLARGKQHGYGAPSLWPTRAMRPCPRPAAVPASAPPRERPPRSRRAWPLGAAAALSDAALVVAHHEEAGLDQSRAPAGRRSGYRPPFRRDRSGPSRQ